MAIARGQHGHAAKLLGAAQETRVRLNAARTGAGEIAELAQAMEQLAEALGEVERDRVMAEGKTMSMDEAVTFALRLIA